MSKLTEEQAARHAVKDVEKGEYKPPHNSFAQNHLGTRTQEKQREHDAYRDAWDREYRHRKSK